MWMWDAVKAEAKVENSCIFELPPDVGRSDLSTVSVSDRDHIFGTQGGVTSLVPGEAGITFHIAG